MGPVPDSHRFLIRPSVRVHAPPPWRCGWRRSAWRTTGGPSTGSAPSPPARPWVRTMPGRVTGRRAGRRPAGRLPNAGVTMDGIPEPHLEATVERRRPEPVILAVRDTTTLNCPTLAATSGPDGPGGGGKGTDARCP